MILLTTGNHNKEAATNIIWLEPEVFMALIQFATQNEFASLKKPLDS
jgi:hypothetical protein